MKKLFLGSMILIIMTISSYAEVRKYYNTGELKLLFPTKVNGKLEGIVTEYYRNGNVKYKWTYHKGKKHGIAKKYENGSLKYIWHYKHGKRSITTKEFNRDGSLKQKWRYRNGKLHAYKVNRHKKYKKNREYRRELHPVDFVCYGRIR